MSLFKVFKGPSSRFNTTSVPLHDGFAYLTPDTEKFYIDAENDGSVKRILINPDINDQTPSYTSVSTLSALTSGERISVAFSKIAKAVSDLISHLADTTRHITDAERTDWNAKTSNIGTITEVTMNGVSKGTSGVVNLGTVITAHQDISGKADLISPTFTGTPNAPTAAAGTNTTQIATTAFVTAAVDNAIAASIGGAY